MVPQSWSFAARTDKSWGFEQLLHNGEYCMKLLCYTKAIASSLHYHERKHETFYVASGIFEVERDFGAKPARLKDLVMNRLAPGDSVILAPGTVHRVRCIHPGVIVEASTHDDPADCVRLVASET